MNVPESLQKVPSIMLVVSNLIFWLNVHHEREMAFAI